MKKQLLLMALALLAAVQPVCAQEVYAVYNDDMTTVTCYYDTQKSSRGGTYFRNFLESITKVVFDASFAGYKPYDTMGWFQDCSNLTTIEGLEYLNMENVTDMNQMFRGCSSLTSLDLSCLNTSKVEKMYSMFQECTSLQSVDLSSFNTSKVTRMDGMFANCTSLRTIYADESRWSTAAVTNSDGMFYDCTSLKGGNGTTYDEDYYDATYARIDKAGQPGYLTHKEAPAIASDEPYAVLSDNNTVLTFYYDNQKESRNGMSVGPFNTSNVRGWSSPKQKILTVTFDPSFAKCTSITSTAYWFCGFTKLTTINGIGYLNTSNVTNMGYMFDSCSALEDIDLSGFDTQNVTNMEYLFSGCYKLKSLDVSGFDTKKVTNMARMFASCATLTSLYLDNFDTGNVKNYEGTFRLCDNLSAIYCDKTWNENIDAVGMFYNCTKLPSNNTGRITGNYQAMFAKPISAGGVFTPTSNYGKELYAVRDNGTLTIYFDDNIVTHGGVEWDKCIGESPLYPEIATVELHNSVALYYPTSTKSWFSNRESLTTIKGMENLNTYVVADMSNMFEKCSQLKDVDLSHINTPYLTTTQNMFSCCSKMEQIDLSNLNTTATQNMSGMFADCENLTTIYVDEALWAVGAVTGSEGMFKNCKKLKGGYGTGYDDNHTDVTYAYIDQEGQPGYLTQKNGSLVTDPEPYAVFDNGTMTFYFDRKCVSRKGYSLISKLNDYFSKRSDIKIVVFDNSFADCTTLTSTARWFMGASKLTEIIGIENLKTGNVTDMSYMFNYCSSLTSLDVSHFDTKNVKNTASMFTSCSKIESLDVNGWDTGNISEMMMMFNNCSKLSTIYCNSTWNPNTSSYWMFYGCTSLPGYNSNNHRAAYARPIADGGYFTPKAVPCATPTISMKDGKLSMECDTEGVEYVSDVKVVDETVIEGSTISLPTKYRVTVYARKEGLADSEPATLDIEMSIGKKGDVNGDGKITITDAVGVVNMILNGEDK